MSRAEEITERLAAALDRIEGAVTAAEARRDAAGEIGDIDEGAAAERVAAAEAERARLAGELEALQSEHVTLRETTDAVSERLDAAIGELRTVLEG